VLVDFGRSVSVDVDDFFLFSRRPLSSARTSPSSVELDDFLLLCRSQLSSVDLADSQADSRALLREASTRSLSSSIMDDLGPTYWVSSSVA